MMDGRSRVNDAGAGRVAGQMAGLASAVVARLVDRDGAAPAVLREDLLLRFMDAVISPVPQGMDGIWNDLRRAGISRTAFADRYVPELARRMGQAWVDDCMGFADVTLGAARLQSVLRDIGRDWAADRDPGAGQAAVLVIIPEDEQHTLGGLVLTGQLRRRGVSVALRAAPAPADLRQLLAARQFDAVLLSAGSVETLDTCRKMMKSLREGGRGRLRIAVGGSAIDRVPDALGRTGADLASNDLATVCHQFGLDKAGAGPSYPHLAARDRNG